MARIPRSQFRDYRVFHVTAKGVAGAHVFLDDLDRQRFTLLLGKAVDMFGWRLHAWCLMGTHFHLLIEAPVDRLSAGMHRLAGLHAQGFNRRWARKGHLYEERFACWVIRDEDHFHNATEYIL